MSNVTNKTAGSYGAAFEKWKIQLGAAAMLIYCSCLLSMYIYFLSGMIRKQVWKEIHVFMIWLISLGFSDVICLSVLFIYCLLSLIGLSLDDMSLAGYWFLEGMEFMHNLGFANIYPHIVGMSVFRFLAVVQPHWYSHWVNIWKVLAACGLCWLLAVSEATLEQCFPARNLIFDPGHFATIIDPRSTFTPQEMTESMGWFVLFWETYMWLACGTSFILNVTGALLLYRRRKREKHETAAARRNSSAPLLPKNARKGSTAAQAVRAQKICAEINLVVIALVLATIGIIEQYVWGSVMGSQMRASAKNFLQRFITMSFFGLNPLLYWAISVEIRKKVGIPFANLCSQCQQHSFSCGSNSLGQASGKDNQQEDRLQ